jgi:pimeloyl-ACP methyl ester carboxylesterase
LPEPQLAYTVHPGKGPYLAMLHGFLSSSAQWQHNLDALSTVCRPVTIDLWGHGDSPAPTEQKHYTPDAYIEALGQVRRALGADTWFVCGYSIGAGITIRYTHEYPNHVLGHIFTNSSSGFADSAQVSKWRADAASGSQNIFDGGIKAINRIPVHPRFAKRLPVDIYTALVSDARELSPHGVGNALLATTPNASIRDIAATNPRPALLCFGTLEKRFAAAKDWAIENMPELSVVELNAGHAVNMEDSEGFNRAACAFISQHTP